MGCCLLGPQPEGAGQVPGDGPLRGIEQKRSCTDVGCCGLFSSFLIAWAYLAVHAFREGDPDRVLRPADHTGTRCGTGARSTMPARFAPLPAEPAFCVCVASCPPISAVVCDEEHSSLSATSLRAGSAADAQQRQALVAAGACWAVTYQSEEMFRQCYPSSPQPAGATAAAGDLAVLLGEWQDGAYLRAGFAEVRHARYAVAAAAAAATALSLSLLPLLRAAPAPTLWAAVLGFLPVVAYAAWKCWSRAAELLDGGPAGDGESVTERVAWTYRSAALALAALCVPYLFLAVWVAQRVRVVAEALREAGRAALDAPSALLVSVPLTLAASAAAGVFWGFVSLYLASVEHGGRYRTLMAVTSADEVAAALPPDDDAATPAAGRQVWVAETWLDGWWALLHVGNFVGLVLLLGFANAVGSFIRSTTVAAWYFSATTTSGDEKGAAGCTACGALCRAVRYHLGSAALGGALVVLAAPARVLALVVEDRVRGCERSPQRCVASCVACFLSCVERSVKLVDPRTYTLIAMYGWPYCTSAREFLRILLDNIASLGPLSALTSFMLLLLRFVVTVLSCAAGWVVLFRSPFALVDGPVHYGHLPLIACAVVSYALAEMLIGAYGGIVSAAFTCFFIDQQSDGPGHYMPADLAQLVEKYSEVERMRVEYQQALSNALYHAGVASQTRVAGGGGAYRQSVGGRSSGGWDAPSADDATAGAAHPLDAPRDAGPAPDPAAYDATPPAATPDPLLGDTGPAALPLPRGSRHRSAARPGRQAWGEAPAPAPPSPAAPPAAARHPTMSEREMSGRDAAARGDGAPVPDDGAHPSGGVSRWPPQPRAQPPEDDARGSAYPASADPGDSPAPRGPVPPAEWGTRGVAAASQPAVAPLTHHDAATVGSDAAAGFPTVPPPAPPPAYHPDGP